MAVTLGKMIHAQNHRPLVVAQATRNLQAGNALRKLIRSGAAADVVAGRGQR